MGNNQSNQIDIDLLSLQIQMGKASSLSTGLSVLAVGTDNQLYTRTQLTQPWVLVPNSAAVKGITYLNDGTIVGVGMDNFLYTRNSLNENWTQVPNSGHVVSVIQLNDNIIVGVGLDNFLYTRASLTAIWVQVPNSGSVMSISKFNDGTIVGIGMDNQLYYRRTLTANWKQVPNSGSVKGVTQLNNGIIVGVGMDNLLYTRNLLLANWIQVSNSGHVIAITTQVTSVSKTTAPPTVVGNLNYQIDDYVVYTASGTDLPNQPMTGTVQDCKLACSQTQGCVGFSRAKDVNDNSSSQCWLKKTHKGRVNYKPYQTFIKQGSEPWRENFGNVEETVKKYHHNYLLYTILILILILIIVYLNRNKL